MKTVCIHCQTRFNVSEKFNGRKVLCPACKKEFIIKDYTETATISKPEHKTSFVSLDKSKEFYSVKELAALLNVNPMTIYRMVQKGKIACFQIGRSKRFRRSDIEVFLSNCAIKRK